MANQHEMFNPYMQQNNYPLDNQSTPPQQHQQSQQQAPPSSALPPQQPPINNMVNMPQGFQQNSLNGYPPQLYAQSFQQPSPNAAMMRPPQGYMAGYMTQPPQSGFNMNMNQGFIPQGFQRPMYQPQQQPQESPSQSPQQQQQLSPDQQQRIMMYNMMPHSAMQQLSQPNQSPSSLQQPPLGMANSPPYNMVRPPPPPPGFNMQQLPPPPQFTNGMNVQVYQQRMHQYQQMVRMQQLQFLQHQSQQPQGQPSPHPHPQFRPPHPQPQHFQHQFSQHPANNFHPQQQHFQYRHHQQPHPHQQLQQQQQQIQAAQPTRRSGRTVKKKKPSYEDSSDEEDLDLSEESEQDNNSEFGDSDEDGSKKRKKGDEDEAVVIPMGTKEFERILDYRRSEETGQEELLIKYKNTSFHHVDWVPLERIEAEHLGKHRVKKFLRKWEEDGEKGEDFREYLKLDRIVDEGELEDPTTGELKIYYLCKWNGLFYEHCTWEKEEDVEKMDEAKIEEFHERRIIPEVKSQPSPPRPDLSRFMKYDRSPAYRYGNELRSYQLEGLNWLRFCYYSFRSCILADEMGLGKTVQSVALLNDIYHILGIKGPFIIIAPLSTIPHWERAFKAWTDLNVIDYRGSTLARNLIVDTEFYYKDIESKNIPDRYKFDVLITTYEMASSSATLLSKIRWKCGVFDEAHRLKNKQSKVLEILKTFYMEHKLLLTGTPLQNNLDELYSLLHFMQPDVFSDENYFFAEYGSLQTAAQVEKLQALLKPIMLRRFKEDVEKTIPVKEETVVEVELTNPQKKWYRAILEKNFSFLRKGAKTNKEMPHLRNIMMQLRKCCIHPYLLEGAEEVIVNECNAKTPQDQFTCLVQSSGKLVLIDKLLKKLILGNHKVLIFSQFTSCLDILSDYLRRRKYAFERIDGSIPGDQRQASIDRFSTLPIEESFVFLLCTRAGGVGINLTAADTCIIFDSDWNPQNDLQAQARCHRIGQTKPVQIYRLICANTYEKDMFDRAGMKLGLDKAVMSRSGPTGEADNGQPNKHELTKQEIENLLKKGAYGAMLDDEASTQFCEEDIDQILERRTKVIKHEGNEQGSVFSKATFSAGSGDVDGVELDDPDFWEKWAAKANIDTAEVPEEKNKLILLSPRRRRKVQRFGTKQLDSNYSDNENEDSDAAYEEEEEEEEDNELPAGRGVSTRRGRRSASVTSSPASKTSTTRSGRASAGGSGSRGRGRGGGRGGSAATNGGREGSVRLWTSSEKAKYERKLMIFGYGAWEQMKADFSRRSEKDLKAVTRALMRRALPTIGSKTDEDKKLIIDIEHLLESDAKDDVPEDDTLPYKSATKKQIAEFQSFLTSASDDYIDHIERKGRNLLLRIQMLHIIRDKIVPKNWEEAKIMPIPHVTGAQPASWWGADEDRSLMLGICKHGYQQYLDIRNDPEFCFAGKKYVNQDDDNASNDKNDEDDDDVIADVEAKVESETVKESSTEASEKEDIGSALNEEVEDEQIKQDEIKSDENDDQTSYVWPSKADIGMRLRRVIAACVREQSQDQRKRKAPADRKPVATRRTRQRKVTPIAPAAAATRRGGRPTRASRAAAESFDDHETELHETTTSVTVGDDEHGRDELPQHQQGDVAMDVENNPSVTEKLVAMMSNVPMDNIKSTVARDELKEEQEDEDTVMNGAQYDDDDATVTDVSDNDAVDADENKLGKATTEEISINKEGTTVSDDVNENENDMTATNAGDTDQCNTDNNTTVEEASAKEKEEIKTMQATTELDKVANIDTNTEIITCKESSQSLTSETENGFDHSSPLTSHVDDHPDSAPVSTSTTTSEPLGQ